MTTVGLEGRTLVYRFFDETGTLLYVGITNDAGVRWAAHAGSKLWWPEVATIKLEWHETREQAEAAELRAIVNESPRWNVRDVPARVVAGPNRVTIRVPDDLWAEFGAVTERIGTDRSTVLRDFILWYVGEHDAELPERPGAS